MDDTLVTKSPDVLGGIAVFAGTRVPVQNLLDYLAEGATIDDFLDDFPTCAAFYWELKAIADVFNRYGSC